MAKNLSALEAVAIARLVASGEPSELVGLVRSHLHEDPVATDALKAATADPRDVDTISRLAGYIRKYGRGKEFRTAVRSALGSRNSVAAIGVAELVTAAPPEQRPGQLVRLVNSRIADDPESRDRLQAAESDPDSFEAVLELAVSLRPRFQRIRSLADVPISEPPDDISPKRLAGALPEFRRVYREEAQGIALDTKAQNMVGDLLRTGSEAIKSAPEDRRGQLIAEAEEKLRQGIQPAVVEIRSNAHEENGAVIVDARTLATAMRANCPLPPFCLTPVADRRTA